MAYYELLLHAWCNWDPPGSDLQEIGPLAALGEEAICTLRESITIVIGSKISRMSRPERFFGREEGDADLSQG